MQNTSELSKALTNIQDRVIGLFHPKFYPAGEYICVIDDTNGRLECLEIGHLLGLSSLHIDSAEGRYVKFPLKGELSKSADWFNPEEFTERATLHDMKNDIVFFHNWYKEMLTQ